ncbi:MAG: 3-deoxy-7-phosphoheptulonate synthase [Phycisphaerales bacterium]|nr:3-deoxy-7-phosphoheptulonate synthase [Phycisphaerales bacterium]
MDWTPDSWRKFPTRQQPAYRDEAGLRAACALLATLPPLVTSWEIESLKSQLDMAASGETFLLQGGDCAESFDDCTPSAITSRLKVLLQMSLVLTYGTRKRVVRVGRFAGQYAKPRTVDSESRGGVDLPAYRGDNVNGLAFDASVRTPDPLLLLRGHERAAMTLNFVRSLVDGGFADLHHPEYWDLEFVKHSPLSTEYGRMVRSIGESLTFMETLAGMRASQISRVDFFTSHECLLLPYEQALTREVPRRSGWWNLSTHFPWLGMRTAKMGEGHVEYLRGIRNPVAVKVGPTTDIDELLSIIDTLDPQREPGKITIIHRMGAHEILQRLPPVIAAIGATGRKVLWCCDPMHGNTDTVVPASGAGKGVPVKTRKFGHILAEIEQAFEIHGKMGTVLGGVHFELTGENVTECTGGARGLSDEDLARAYRTQVDPRLNYEQALELAMLMSRRMSGGGW